MTVTDNEVAPLRALLLQEMDEHHRLLDLLSEEEIRSGYFGLVTAAFFVAVEQRFTGRSRREIVDWIARIRATMDPGDRIDPDVAEKLFLWVFGEAGLDDVDYHVGMRHQTLLLVVLVEERQYDGRRLEEFLARAREIAEQVS